MKGKGRNTDSRVFWWTNFHQDVRTSFRAKKTTF